MHTEMCVYKLYRSMSSPVKWKYVKNCGNSCTHTLFFKSEGHMFDIISPPSTRARQKLQFARSTANINISNLLCCATANRTDTTQRVLINHDYEAPLAAASLGSQ